MPPQRRFRRLGTTSAAVSLGALTLVITGAGPAGAGIKDCAKGADPTTTLQKVSCRLENITGETLELTGDITTGITGGGDDGDPRPAAPPKESAQEPTRPRPAPRTPAPSEQQPRHEPAFTVHGVRPIQLPRPDGEPPAAPASETELSRLLPQPRVAAAPPPAAVPPAPVDRLVTPVASADQQNTQLLAVAAAAGLAGAVGALNLSVAGRRLRRSKT